MTRRPASCLSVKPCELSRNGGSISIGKHNEFGGSSLVSGYGWSRQRKFVSCVIRDVRTVYEGGKGAIFQKNRFQRET